jgi:hypothetical protein
MGLVIFGAEAGGRLVLLGRDLLTGAELAVIIGMVMTRLTADAVTSNGSPRVEETGGKSVILWSIPLFFLSGGLGSEVVLLLAASF